MVYIGKFGTNYNDNILQVRVDRKSPLGNPFVMSDESQRDSVCDLYEKYFRKQVKHEIQSFCNELESLLTLANERDIRLMCWCSPKRCHAETIRDWILNNEKYIGTRNI